MFAVKSIMLRSNYMPVVECSIYGNSGSDPTYAAAIIEDCITFKGKTLSIWIKKATSTGYGTFYSLCNQMGALGSDYNVNEPGRVVIYTGSSTYLSAGTVFGIDSSGYVGNKANALNTTDWTQCTVTISDAGVFTLYKNGVSLGTLSNATNFKDRTRELSWVGVMGTGEWGGQRNFKGNVCRAVIWDKVLTAQEVLSDYELKCNPPVGSSHYWPGTVKSGKIVDYVGGKDMTIYGSISVNGSVPS